MKSIDNIKKVSLGFFLVLGFAHILTTVLITNGIELKYMIILSKLIAVPFAVTGLLYGFASLRLLLTKPDTDHRTLDIILASVTGLIFIGLLVINFAFPNLPQ